MGPWSRVRVAKCQMLVTCFFILLLGLSVATMVTLTYFGAHFAVIRRVFLEKNPYQAMHQWAFSAGLSLVGLLTLGAVLSAAATVREAQGLMAGGFLCFSLAFCAQVQVVFWRLHSPTQVEDTMLDTYDLVYEQVMKGTSHVRRQELAAIQDVFLCCGKRSPFSRLGSTEADLCQAEEAAREGSETGLPPPFSGKMPLGAMPWGGTGSPGWNQDPGTVQGPPSHPSTSWLPALPVSHRPLVTKVLCLAPGWMLGTQSELEVARPRGANVWPNMDTQDSWETAPAGPRAVPGCPQRPALSHWASPACTAFPYSPGGFLGMCCTCRPAALALA
ncbi:tetraspanin-32 isoform X4 [Symphalangus syndactylus]|uniref:tetraspanin-32 isoform X4 n=1 Tax=Symphalangus syndactylus TaxID=9590 RepID=UPI0030054F17